MLPVTCACRLLLLVLLVLLVACDNASLRLNCLLLHVTMPPPATT